MPALLVAAAACQDIEGPGGGNPPDSQPALAFVLGALDNPVFVTAPPSDTTRLFIVLQDGTIGILRGNTLLATPFLDLTSSVRCCGERGLLGLAFHPDYATNGRFYASYTDTAGDTRVVRFLASADPDVADPASGDTVLTQDQPFSNHNGGMIAFGADGYLYVGLGDGGSGGDPQDNGQDSTTLLGKILRLDVDGAAPYAIPPDNPFVGRAGWRPEIWALGLRNPWRFSFDRLTGDLYIGDVGQNAREEVNARPASSSGGENYGWNRMEGTVCYLAGCSSAGLTLPVFDYVNPDEGCAVTGGYVYRGSRLPGLEGLYLFSDYCSRRVRSFRLVGGQATDIRDWPALSPIGNVSSFGEDARGELYVVEHGPNGRLYRIIPFVPLPD